MVSRNNIKHKIENDSKRIPHWSLRKLSIGVASVLLGTTFYFGSGAVAHADTTNTATPTTTVINPTTTDTNSTGNLSTTGSNQQITTPTTTNSNTENSDNLVREQQFFLKDEPNAEINVKLNGQDVSPLANSGTTVGGRNIKYKTQIDLQKNNQSQDTVTVTYHNLENSMYNGQHIKSAIYTFKDFNLQLDSGNLIIANNPYDGFETNNIGDVKIDLQYFYDDEMKNPVNFKSGSAIIVFASLNNSGTTASPHIEKARAVDGIPVAFDGSSVKVHEGGWLYADDGAQSGQWMNPRTGQLTTGNWDNIGDGTYFGAGAAKISGTNPTVEFGTDSNGGSYVWSLIQTDIPQSVYTDPKIYTVTETVHYKYSDGKTAYPDYTKSLEFQRTGYKDATGKINLDKWVPQSFPAVQIPEINGYTADTTSIPAVNNVTGDTKNIEKTVVYTPKTYSGQITYVDQNGNTIHQQTLTGVTGQTITVTPEVPAGWKIVSGNIPSSITITGDGITSQIITIAHSTVLVQPTDPKTPADTLPDNPGKKYPSGVAKDDLNHTATRIVTITDLNGKTTKQEQTAHVSRTATVDEVTGDVTYGNWSTDIWPAIPVPTIPGYTPSATAPEVTVTGETKDQTVDITYNANTQKGQIIYVDPQGKQVTTTPLTGKTGETIKVVPQIPAGWKIVPNQQIPATVTATVDGIPTVTVQVEHATTTVQPNDPKTPADTLPDNPGKKYPSGVAKDDLNKTVTRTIIVNTPNAQPTTVKQTVKLTRTATVDEVTGNVSYSDWTTGQWASYTAPTVSGYTANSVPAEPVNGNTADTTVTVNYNGNAESTTVTYIDADNGNQPIGQPTTINGKVGQTVSISIPKGYTYFSGPTSYTFTAQNKPLTVVLKHKTETKSESKTITEKVVYVLPGQTTVVPLKDSSRSIKFTRNVTTDLATGKVTYDAWDNNGSYTFQPYEKAMIDGWRSKIQTALNTAQNESYKPNENDLQKLSQPITVTPDSSDVTITIGFVKPQQVDYLTIEYDYVVEDEHGNKQLKAISSTPIYGSHLSGDNKQMIISQYELGTLTKDGTTYTFAPENTAESMNFGFKNGIKYEPSDGKYPAAGKAVIHLLYKTPESATETNTKVTVKYVLANGQQLLPDQTVDSYDANKVKKVIVSGGHIYKLVSGNTEPDSNGQVTLQYQKIR